MTEYFLLIFWLFFTVYFVMRYVYRKAFSPYLLDKERFHVFALRDQLRRLSQVEGGSSFCHMYLEKIFNSGVHGVGGVSLLGFFFYLLDHMGSDGKITRTNSDADYERFQRDASPELKELSSELSWALMRAMCINSPIITTLILCVVKLIGIFRPADSSVKIIQERSEKVLYTHQEIFCTT